MVYANTPDTVRAEVKLAVRAFDHARTLQVQLNHQPVFEAKVGEAAPNSYSFELTLPRGHNELKLISLDGDQSPAVLDPTSKDTHRLAFAVHGVQISCLDCSLLKKLV